MSKKEIKEEKVALLFVLYKGHLLNKIHDKILIVHKRLKKKLAGLANHLERAKLLTVIYNRTGNLEIIHRYCDSGSNIVKKYQGAKSIGRFPKQENISKV